MDNTERDRLMNSLDPFGHGPMHWDRSGKPISMGEWMQLASDDAYKILAQEQIGPAFVSTVWTGLDASFSRDRPAIFETMIFGGPQDLWRMVHRDEEEAMGWHRIACAMAHVNRHGWTKWTRDERRAAMKRALRGE